MAKFPRLRVAAPPPVWRRPRRRQWRPGVFLMPLAFTLAGMAGALALSSADGAPDALFTAQGGGAHKVHFALCGRHPGATCITDGDTFRLQGEKIRIADIDAPEVFSPKCAAEKALGDRATTRLLALLNAGPFTLAPIDRDRDVYGRQLRIVMRDGRSLGAELVAEGLARPWDGARHPWCG